MPDVTLFAAHGDHVVRGAESGEVELSTGEAVPLLANGQPGEKLSRPPEIRPPMREAVMATSFDAEAGVFRVEEPPPGPPEDEQQIVVEAPTAGELDVQELTEVIDVARQRDSNLIVLLKRDG